MAVRSGCQHREVNLEPAAVGDQVDHFDGAVLETAGDAILAAEAHRRPWTAHVDLAIGQIEHQAVAAYDDLSPIAAGKIGERPGATIAVRPKRQSRPDQSPGA